MLKETIPIKPGGITHYIHLYPIPNQLHLGLQDGPRMVPSPQLLAFHLRLQGPHFRPCNPITDQARRPRHRDKAQGLGFVLGGKLWKYPNGFKNLHL